MPEPPSELAPNGDEPEQPAPSPLQPHFELANSLLTSYIHTLQIAGDLQKDSMIEPVSGLYNGRKLEAEFNGLQHHGLQRREREGDAGVYPNSLALIDLDHFSEVNDRLGHDGGNQVIRSIGEAIKSSVRQRDVVARITGGDEIAVLLPRVSLELAIRKAETMRLRSKGRTGVTLSIGLTGIRPGETLDDVVRRADAALYGAKGRGRDKTVVIDPDTYEQITVIPATGEAAA